MFYLLHGDDEFSSREQLRKIRQQGNFEYNQDVYDGAEIDLTTLFITTTTMPFLTEQRLVIVEGLPKRKRGEATGEAPPSSASADAGEGETKGGRAKRGK